MLLDDLEEEYKDELSKLNLRSQEDVLFWYETSVKHMLGLQGPVGSGKTFIGSVCFLMWVYFTDFSEVFEDERVVLVMAKTQAQLRKMGLQMFKKAYKLLGFEVEDEMFKGDWWHLYNKHTGSITARAFVFGEQGSAARADSIVGDNYLGFFIDEVDNVNQEIMKELINRLGRTFQDWKGIGVSNPEGPDHPYQVNFLENEERAWQIDYWTLPLKAALGPIYTEESLDEYVKSLMTANPEPHDRMKSILGIPSNPGNLVLENYRSYFVERDEIADIRFVGVDFGSVNTTACVEIGFDGKSFHAQRELIIEKNKTRNPTIQSEMIHAFFGDPAFYVVDQTADGIIAGLEQLAHCPVHESFWTRDDSDSLFKRLLATGELTVGNLPNLKREMSQWHYDKKQIESGKRPAKGYKPVRENDHFIDATKYGMEYGYMKYTQQEPTLMIGGYNA